MCSSDLRLKDLKPGDRIVRAVRRMDSGRGKPAPMKDATHQCDSKGFVSRTITNISGKADTDRIRAIQSLGEMPTLSTAMALVWKITKCAWWNRVENALYAVNRLQKKMLGLIGGINSAWTTTMKPEQSEVCCVTTATSLSDMAKPQKSCCEPLSIYETTVDEIVNIVEFGCKDVFDIQVERTENFIAEGLVSHNTRWHEDDLSGWLLKDHQHEGWEVLNLPALCEKPDELGRVEGEPLWPEAYPAEELDTIRKSVGSRDWNALYQQRPAAAEGSVFKKENWRFYKPLELEPKSLANSLECHTICQAWDTAFKTGSQNDFSVCVTIGVSSNRYYVLDLWRDRVEFPDLKRIVQAQSYKWGPHAILVEDTAAGQSLLQELTRNTRLPLLPVKADRDKVSRSNAVTPSHEAGLIYLPEDARWLFEFLEEMGSFPNAVHDDQVDAFVHALTWALRVSPPTYEEPEEEFFGKTTYGWLA